jgi:MFS family permease
METTVKSTSQTSIKWQQVWSLVALDVAIIISWMAYHKYQPSLVTKFGFDGFKFPLAIVQGFILFITPPIAGSIADRIRRTKGDRLPVINMGISVVSMVFMAVALTIFVEPDGLIRWIFPVLIVLWLISMNIFHSPAISMVETFVPSQNLPQVIALFAIVAGLAESLEPSIVYLIDAAGAPITFAAGGTLVFATGWILQKSAKKLTANTEDITPTSQVENSNFLLVVALGLLMGLVITLLFNIFPDYLEKKIHFLDKNSFKGSYFVSILAAISALISYPIGRWIERYGIYKSAQIGLIGALLLAFGIFASPNSTLTTILCFLFPIPFSIISVSSLPIAFANLCDKHKVLGIGLFFSGVEFANSIVEILQAGGFY